MVAGFRRLGFAVFLLAGVCAAHEGAAQPAGQGAEQGVLRLTGWPASAAQAEAAAGEFDRHTVLPALDTLSLGYRYAVVEGQPYLTMALEWVPASYGYLGGRKVSYERLPSDLRMTAAAFRSEVHVGGERVSELVIALDGIVLGPHPDLYVFEVTNRPWDSLFVDTSAPQARRYFEEGFELRNLELVHVAFAASEQIAEERRRPSVGRPRPDEVVVYPGGPRAGVDIWLGGIFRRPPQLVGGEPVRSAPRGDEVGRGRGDAEPSARDRRAGVGSTHDDPRQTAERGRVDRGDSASEETAGSGAAAQAEQEEERRTAGRKEGARRGEKQKSEEEDEDEEEDVLKGPALTALAALGVIAYTGGTVGYYGNAEQAPLGLVTGFVRSSGGVLLQAGVNEALLTDSPGPKHLLGRLMGFYGPYGSRVQPAVGVGALAVEEGPDLEVLPSLSLGAVGNFGPVLILGAYDVLNGGAEFGLAFNFRSRRFAASEE